MGRLRVLGVGVVEGGFWKGVGVGVKVVFEVGIFEGGYRQWG